MKSFFDENIKLYRRITPSLKKIESMFKLHPNSYTADHVAFRTFKSCGGINIFHNLLKTEYTQMDKYIFPSKKLNTVWYKPESRNLPRIFLSEIDDTQLSQECQNIIKYAKEDKHYSYFQEDEPEHVTLIEKEAYDKLFSESEYAAWTLIHGCKINHVALSIESVFRNFLDINNSNIHVLISLLKEKNIKMLEKGGLVKTSADGLLLQSSIVSDSIILPFMDKHKKLYYDNTPGGFVEFVERKSGRDGFEADNALNIFDSTSVTQNKK